jgi:hypothetical protein
MPPALEIYHADFLCPQEGGEKTKAQKKRSAVTAKRGN